jgi:protease-4
MEHHASESASAGGSNAGWERRLIEQAVLANVTEQRRARRWRTFFRLLTIGGALVVALWAFLPEAFNMGGHHPGGRHTALIDVDGVIDSSGPVTADAVIDSLRAAFKDSGTTGVILRINSPGGSPVQAGLINDEIRRLRAEHPNTPLHAVIEDICASGGYYVAAAADRIYVDKASLVGSIGVLMDGFGFTDLMNKVGVERRLLSAGENKGFLDPFSPMTDTQRAHAQKMLGSIHQQFIDTVKAGRGQRLKDSPELFSGLVWTGSTSIELGLADELGSVRSVARDVLKAEDIVDFTHRETLTERLAKRAGIAAGQTIARSIGAGGESLRLR